MSNQIQLNDIADELLILNKMTVDKLFKSEQPADCIALYVFYYKTAKWQKTNRIKANDNYVKKSLKWGIKRVSNTKKTLKDLGLISIVQSRKDGKVDGWYIEVSYMVTENSISKIKVETNNTQNDIVDSNNTQKQQVAEATSGFQDTDALKEIDKMLEDKKGDVKKPHGQNQLGVKEKKRSSMSKNKDKAQKPHGQNNLGAAYPENLNIEAFNNWIDYRKKIKKPYKDVSIPSVIESLCELNQENQMRCIKDSIRNGYQGFFPDKFKNKNQKPLISQTEFKTSGVNFA